MKTCIGFLLLVTAAASCAAEDVWQCTQPGGQRYYTAKKLPGQDCKKVDLPEISSALPDPGRNAARTDFSRVRIGMSIDEARSTLDKPARMRRMETRTEITETWFYPGQRALTFINGSLEIIEEG